MRRRSLSKDIPAIPSYGDEMTILEYVKTKVDIEHEDGDNAFDGRLLIDIESALAELQQLTELKLQDGITDKTTFEDILESSDEGLLMLCKTFVGICVRLTFDPPAGSVLTSLEKSKDTIASRITIQPKEVLNE